MVNVLHHHKRLLLYNHLLRNYLSSTSPHRYSLIRVVSMLWSQGNITSLLQTSNFLNEHIPFSREQHVIHYCMYLYVNCFIISGSIFPYYINSQRINV